MGIPLNMTLKCYLGDKGSMSTCVWEMLGSAKQTGFSTTELLRALNMLEYLVTLENSSTQGCISFLALTVLENLNGLQ